LSIRLCKEVGEDLSSGLIEGICSRHFKGLRPGSDVFFSLKEGTLNFPIDCGVPFMIVGPGTGIAPFISFLEERETLLEEKGLPMSRHKHMVFFGCRNKEKDWLHREIMTRMQKEEK
jgi:sulfite reductase alpha subunit-like flavoprotein